MNNSESEMVPYPILDILRPPHSPIDCTNLTGLAQPIEGKSTEAKCSTPSNSTLLKGKNLLI